MDIANVENFTTAIEDNFNDLKLALVTDDSITSTYEDFDYEYEIYINGDIICSTPIATDAMGLV